MQQVITIAPNGQMSGLQVKPGKGLDLTKFGPASVKRASEIVWDEDAQAWKIDVLQAAGKGVVTYRVLGETLSLEAFMVVLPTMLPDNENIDQPALFSSYDEAVQAEIAYLDALRLKGQF